MGEEAGEALMKETVGQGHNRRPATEVFSDLFEEGTATKGGPQGHEWL